MKMQKSLLAIYLMVAVPGCIDGTLFFKQSGSSNLKNKGAGAGQTVTTNVDAYGGETGTIVAGASITQTIAVSDQSPVAGTVVSFAPGTLAIDTEITVEQGVTVATESFAAELGMGGNISSTGTAVSVQPATASDPTQPFTLSIPLPTSLTLNADEQATLVIAYKVKKAADGTIVVGVIHRDSLELNGGLITFAAEHFGVFQPVFTKTVVNAITPVAVSSPIQLQRDVANLPQIQVTGRSPFAVAAGQRIQLTGTNFRPTMTLAMGGKKVSDLSIASDVSASFIAPAADNTGALNLTIDQDGAAQTITLFYRPGDTNIPLITEPEGEVCLGKKYYDATGILRTGKRACSGPDLSKLTPEILKAGTVVAGVTGTYSPDFPDPANVYNDTVNGVAGTLTLPAAAAVRTGNGVFGPAGSGVTPSLADCISDGGIGCVAVTGFKAADMSQVTAGNIKLGVTIAGISGTLMATAPACSSDGASSCVVDGTAYKAAALAGLADKIISGQSVAGVPGNVALPAVGKVLNGTPFGVSGATLTGTLTLPAAGHVLTTNGGFGDPGAAVTPTLTIPNVGDVYTGIAYGVGGIGSTGTLTLAGAGNVRTSNGAFGRNGSSVSPSLTDCSTDGGTNCVAVSGFKAADMSNVLAANIKNAVTIAGVVGGLLPAPAECEMDNQISCVAVLNFPAVDKLNSIVPNRSNIRASVTIAGETGTLADCADGDSGCFVLGPLQAAATVAGSASKILSGQTVAGIPGNVTLPDVGKVLAGIPFGVSGSGQTGTLTLPLASNVLTGSGTYGDASAVMTPSYSPDYPAVSNVLSSDTVNSVAGTLTLPAVGDVNSGVSYGVAGTGSTGSLTLPAAGNVLTGSGAFGNPGSAITPTLTLPSAANVKSGTGPYGNPGSAITPTYSPDFPAVANVYSDTVNGVAGTLALPVVGDVYTGTAYGVGGNGSTGTLTLASAANVRTGNGVFGRSGNSVTPSLTDCSTDGGTSCVAVPAFKAADMTNVVAANIKSGVTIAAISGTMVAAPANCAADGATSCVAVTNFPAVDKVNNITANAAKIRDSVTIAGVAGTLADCADGGSGCVAVGPLQAAATVAGSASKILSGQAVAGISGNVTLPAVGKVLAGIQFGISGTGQTGTLSLPVASNVLTGSGTYGDPGAAVTPSFSPDFPAVSNVLSSDTVNSVAGTLTLPAVGDVNSGVSYGVAGTGSTGTLTLPAAGNVLAGSGAFGNPGSAITPTLTLPSAADVKSGTGTYGNPGSAITPTYSPDFPAVANVYSDTVDGTAGTLALPPASHVLTATSYGVSGTGSVGTLIVPLPQHVRTVQGPYGPGGNANTPTLQDCSADGAIACVAVNGFPAADMTNVVASKIKSGVTIAGVVGDYPSVSSPLTGADGTADLDTPTFDAKIKSATNFEWFDSSGARYVYSGDPDISASNILNTASIFGTQGTLTTPTAPDPWDVRAGQTINGVTGQLKVACRNSAASPFTTVSTVDDYNNGGGVFTVNSPTPWTAVNFCGGVDNTNNPNPSAVWIDTTTDGVCDITGDECRFKDKITGLEWSESQPSPVTWATGTNTTCANLSFGGAGPGPWRVPTQKELMVAYEHGIYSAQNPNWISSAMMNADLFWSSSTQSSAQTNAWVVNLSTGLVNSQSKTLTANVVCVR